MNYYNIIVVYPGYTELKRIHELQLQVYHPRYYTFLVYNDINYDRPRKLGIVVNLSDEDLTFLKLILKDQQLILKIEERDYPYYRSISSESIQNV